jgi:hypothetical protein
MEVAAALRTILPLALTSGINLYLTVLVVGLSIRYGWVTDAPPGLHALAAPPILIGAGVLYAIEFVADKIPLVDSLWDLFHTVIRPAGAILIATSSLGVVDPQLLGAAATLVDVSPRVQIAGALVACVVALLSHGGKAGTRTVINVTGASVTLGGVALSLAEDVLVAVLAFLALRYPFAANVIAGVVLIALIVAVPQLLRWAWFALRALFARIKALGWQIRRPEPLPPEHAALLGGPPELSVHCQAQGLRPIRGRYGYLALLGDYMAFTYTRWFRVRAWRLPREQIREVRLRRGLLLLVLEIAYSDGARARLARFAFTADRAPLAEQLAGRLGRAASVEERMPTVGG